MTGINNGLVGKKLGNAVQALHDVDFTAERKICAIGVRSSHFVTMHGLALNVNTDLRYFGYINPCGFINKGVTSIEKEVGHKVPFEEVVRKLEKAILSLLGEVAE